MRANPSRTNPGRTGAHSPGRCWWTRRLALAVQFLAGFSIFTGWARVLSSSPTGSLQVARRRARHSGRAGRHTGGFMPSGYSPCEEDDRRWYTEGVGSRPVRGSGHWLVPHSRVLFQTIRCDAEENSAHSEPRLRVEGRPHPGSVGWHQGKERNNPGGLGASRLVARRRTWRRRRRALSHQVSARSRQQISSQDRGIMIHAATGLASFSGTWL